MSFNNKILAIDFETSGLNPSIHAPIQIGAVIFDLETETVFQSFSSHIGICKRREYDPEALKISGATMEKIETYPSVRSVCDSFSMWYYKNAASTLDVIAFNAPFDFSFYSTMLFCGGRPSFSEGNWIPYNPILLGGWKCAKMYSQFAFQGKDSSQKPEKLSLSGVAKFLELPPQGELHDALFDAELAARIYSKVLKLLTG